jgi:hypothetical protein
VGPTGIWPVGNEACETMMMNISALAQVVGGCAAQEEWCYGSSKECSLARSKGGHNKRTYHYAQVIAYAWSSAWELPFGKYSAGDHLLLLCVVQSVGSNPGSLSC